MGKIRYLTTKFKGQDGEIWVNKSDVLKLLQDDSISIIEIREKLLKCYYKELKNNKNSE